MRTRENHICSRDTLAMHPGHDVQALVLAVFRIAKKTEICVDLIPQRSCCLILCLSETIYVSISAVRLRCNRFTIVESDGLGVIHGKAATQTKIITSSLYYSFSLSLVSSLTPLFALSHFVLPRSHSLYSSRLLCSRSVTVRWDLYSRQPSQQCAYWKLYEDDAVPFRSSRTKARIELWIL